MGRRYGTLFIFVMLTATLQVAAQPTLPDIAAHFADGSVILSWANQYDKVKAITVMRSQDSLTGYEIIGYVKKRDKGIQTFSDDDPEPGRNYYKLSLLFNSGLTWRSNFTGIDVAVVAEPPIATETPTQPKPAQMESAFKPQGKKIPDTCKRPTNQVAVNLSFTEPPSPETSHPRIRLPHNEELDVNTPIFIRSRFIYLDSASGHVTLTLPDDLNSHTYSVRFWDKDKHFVTEIPKVNSPRLLMDKKNFPRRGVYKFTIRKDYLELESGFIIVDPTH